MPHLVQHHRLVQMLSLLPSVALPFVRRVVQQNVQGCCFSQRAFHRSRRAPQKILPITGTCPPRATIDNTEDIIVGQPERRIIRPGEWVYTSGRIRVRPGHQRQKQTLQRGDRPRDLWRTYTIHVYPLQQVLICEGSVKHFSYLPGSGHFVLSSSSLRRREPSSRSGVLQASQEAHSCRRTYPN